METLAQVQNLLVQYGNITAVKDVSFQIRPGEIFAIIGPNGSGKTSAVECLEGLRRPAGGSVTVFGQSPLAQRKQVYAHLGVQLQDVQYPDKIKVDELCAWFASFYTAPADWRLLLSQLGLADKQNRTVRRLSGGEKQRLSVLLALLPRPKLLILDELTTGLDPEVRRGLWDSLKTIRDAGVGIVLVSHYMEEVTALADRLLFLLRGEAIFTGTLAELYTYARSTLPPESWREDLSLEDIYLLLAPQEGRITMEALL